MNNTVETSNRLYYLDWLRVLAMIGIFFFHNARFYDEWSSWHVKNATTNLGASVLVAFLGQFIMPLFFLIAGAGIFFAQRSRRAEQFAQERALRLLVPLIFGLFVIVVPQAYFEALSNGTRFDGLNFFQIYHLYFSSVLDNGYFQEWYHLWFLWYLFMFSIVAIPLFFSWKTGGESILTRLSLKISKPWQWIALVTLSVAVVHVFLYPAGYFGNENTGGMNIVTYMLFFVFGYLIFANPRIMETVKKMTRYTLAIGIVALGVAAGFFVDEISDPVAYYGTASYAVSQILQTINTWCWILVALGLGSKFLNRSNQFLTYSNEAVLPFYVLHQTIIITIGFYVVQWNTGVGPKYITIAASSFVAIMLVYEFLVRRFNVLRSLFGMKLNRKASGTPRQVLVKGQAT